LQLLFPSKKIIHDDCRPHKALKIEEPPSNIFSFLEWPKSDELIKHKADLKDINWFKKLYSTLVDKYDRWSYFQKHYYRYNVEYDFFWDKMHDFHKAIIPTNEFKLAKINECYINPRGIDIPEQIKDKFKIVHPKLEEDEKFNEFRKRVNIAELTEEDIKNVFKKQEILQLSEESWQNLPDKIKVEKIKHLKDLWASGYLALQDFNFLTLKNKNNFWRKPESLFFSKEYQPEHNLEIISLEKKLYDMPLEFISTEFIQNVDEDTIKQWYKFFKELGVDNQLEDKTFLKSLVQRIGILLALKYEASKGRRAQELSQSEETGGYDIKQAEEEPEEVYGIIRSEERYIEVKSRRGPNPDIFLTTKQISTLRNKQDKYFVYVIKDALRYPTLCVTRGDKLLSITDIKIIIPFNKWSSEAQEDEFQP
jgi:hypothetical protein